MRCEKTDNPLSCLNLNRSKGASLPVKKTSCLWLREIYDPGKFRLSEKTVSKAVSAKQVLGKINQRQNIRTKNVPKREKRSKNRLLD